ncbi:uncharacterized protein LOC120843021 [Ixodes scapularis]|uniref:uncharacterized protein LOC120843021 n=1 Tax=Ixodes scapularis TaxID=6945 RepID=UPI001C3836DC|nr:uncharacterized protein LOC120843021 [Ixodes scapularis]
MADANAGGEQPTTEQLVHQLGTISRRLPTFWPADPELWFAQVEQEFARRNITAKMLRELFLQRLPSDVRRILATSSNIPLDDLAELADKILDTAPPMIQATTYPTSGHPLPATEASSFDFQRLHDDVAHLITEVAALRQHRPNLPQPNHMRHSFSKGRADTPPVCWYHRNYGPRAHNCSPPCSWP